MLILDERHRLAFGKSDRKHRTTAEIGAAFENLSGLIVADKQALWTADSGASRQAEWWNDLWQYVRGVCARLVIVDPASAALADADVSQTGPVRKFLRALMHEARQAECGVLVVSHSTKAARNALRRGDDPGAGVVAGSAAWYDGARGVLSLECPATIRMASGQNNCR